MLFLLLQLENLSDKVQFSLWIVSLREMTKGKCIHSAKHMLVFRWKSKEVSMCSYNVSVTR